MSPTLRAWVRQLRQRPGITQNPVCPACGVERPLAAFAGEICRLCATERDLAFIRMRLDEIAAENMRPDGTPGMPPISDTLVDDGLDFEVGHG